MIKVFETLVACISLDRSMCEQFLKLFSVCLCRWLCCLHCASLVHQSKYSIVLSSLAYSELNLSIHICENLEEDTGWRKSLTGSVINLSEDSVSWHQLRQFYQVIANSLLSIWISDICSCCLYCAGSGFCCTSP